jgi:hypothetical protein
VLTSHMQNAHCGAKYRLNGVRVNGHAVTLGMCWNAKHVTQPNTLARFLCFTFDVITLRRSLF